MKQTRMLALAGVMLTACTLLMGCPTGGGNNEAQYDLGFAAGYAQDNEYWLGYDDSWATRDGGTIFYSGDEIQYLDEVSYDAGYYDGLWWAYNDGYFVAYDYAFTIGFSEGYDLAYYPDYLDFLANDEHVEWLDGGFTDGYNDGFSEGRILGATDYRDDIAYDWFEAMEWYRTPHDAYIEELDLGTGEFGPVVLYEYGQNPDDLIEGTKSTADRLRGGRTAPSIRGNAAFKAEEPELSYRALIPAAEQNLNVRPTTSPRSGRGLELDTTWLQRIQQYVASMS